MSVTRAKRAWQLPLALLPLLAAPASAGAVPNLTLQAQGGVEHGSRGTGPGYAFSSDQDGIVSPGEKFGVIARWTNSGDSYEGGKAQVSPLDEPLVNVDGTQRSIAEQNGIVANDPGYVVGGAPADTMPFQVQLLAGTPETTYQCGKNLTLRVARSDISSIENFTVPTGAPGALRSYVSSQVGAPLAAGGSRQLRVTVPTDEKANGKPLSDYTRGVRVTLTDFQYSFSPRWLQLDLVDPDGKSVRVFSDNGDDDTFPGNWDSYDTPPPIPDRTYSNITFVSKGDPSGLTRQQLKDNPLLFKSGAVIQADTDLSALFSGGKRSGNWTLTVKDIEPEGTARSGPRRPSGGRALSSNSLVGTVGGWTLGVNAAICSATPNTKAGPDAWFGDTDPVVLDPATGGTLSAAGSSVAKSDDPSFTAPTISGYAWDTHTAEGAPASYTDGTGSSITLPAQSRGTKVVKLRVTDSNGNTGTVQRTVVFSELPTVDSVVANPAMPQAGESTTLTATVSDSAGFDKIAKVEWDTNDDGVWETGANLTGSGATATGTMTTTFNSAGVHVVRLRITNDLGATATRSVVITTSNLAPIPAFTFQNSTGQALPGEIPVVATNTPITFNGSTSKDTDGTIEEFTWNPDTQNSGTYTSTKKVPTFTYSYTTPGTYEVTLNVVDNFGEPATVNRSIRVAAAPVARITASTVSAVPGQEITFSGAGSTDNDGTIVTYAWSFAVGAPFSTTGQSVTKSFANAGVYTVQLRVTDSDGLTHIATTIVNVKAAATGGGTGGGSTPGGGTGGGGGTPTGNPTGTPTGNGGGGGGVVENPQTAPGTQPGTQTPGTQVAQDDPFGGDGGDAPPAIGSTESGFLAKLSAGSKFKTKKVLKGGMAVKLTANGGSTLVMKAMVTKAEAKKLGLKSKAKTMAIGSGKVVLKKSGSAKFVVKIPKKYQRYVKRAKKTKVVLRAVVTTDGGEQLALARTVYLVK